MALGMDIIDVSGQKGDESTPVLLDDANRPTLAFLLAINPKRDDADDDISNRFAGGSHIYI